MKLFNITIIFTLLFWSQLSSAGLMYRGNGLVYDNILNVTWLLDANYAKTSGFHDTGRMSWSDANTFVNSLEYAGFTDWRLPTIDPEDPTCLKDNGATNGMHHCKSTTNELGYMFYHHLNLPGYRDENGDRDSNWVRTPYGEHISNTFTDLLTQQQLSFLNFNPWAYFSSIEHESLNRVWHLQTQYGRQDFSTPGMTSFVWVVRSGDVLNRDVAPVPLPPTLALLGLGLAIISLRKKQVFKTKQ